MLFLPIVAFTVITLLVPWLHVFLNGWDLSLPRLANTLNLYLHMRTGGIASNINATSNPLINIDSQVVYDPLLEQERTLELLPKEDLIHEVDGIVSEWKKRIFGAIVIAYYHYVPDAVIHEIGNVFDVVWKHDIYKYYKSEEALIKNVLFVLGFLIFIKLGASIYASLFPKVIKPIQFPKAALPSHQYLEFETIPLCVGKGDFEENQILKSYQELFQKTNNTEILKQFEPLKDTEGDTNITSLKENVLSSSTPNQRSPISELEEPLIFGKSITLNSTIPEDSFEREERKLDNNSFCFNNTDNNIVNNNSPATPRTVTSDFALMGSSSPSKILFSKRSFSLLTTKLNPIQVNASSTTVGDITQETVYSEPFSSDDSITSPLKTKTKGK